MRVGMLRNRHSYQQQRRRERLEFACVAALGIAVLLIIAFDAIMLSRLQP